ncbi:MAG: hypothetical protein M1299_03625 [Firmicutes bacterium]|nr:hypothetical protein [Bacillota bacterium]MCL5038906.1 hypothetical protein [Bacillota bacterium]
MDWFTVVIINLLFLLLGYALGRRRGLLQGEKHGMVVTPLLLKEEVLSRGICPLCGTAFFTMEEQVHPRPDRLTE